MLVWSHVLFEHKNFNCITEMHSWLYLVSFFEVKFQDKCGMSVNSERRIMREAWHVMTFPFEFERSIKIETANYGVSTWKMKWCPDMKTIIFSTVMSVIFESMNNLLAYHYITRESPTFSAFQEKSHVLNVTLIGFSWKLCWTFLAL